MKLRWGVLLIIHILIAYLSVSVSSQRSLRSRSSLRSSSSTQDYENDHSSSTEVHTTRRYSRRNDGKSRLPLRSQTKSREAKDLDSRDHTEVVILEPKSPPPKSFQSVRMGRRKDSPTAVIPVVNNGGFSENRKARIYPARAKIILNPQDTANTEEVSSESVSRENRQALRSRGSSMVRGRQRYSPERVDSASRRSDYIDESNLEIYNLDMETGRVQERDYSRVEGNREKPTPQSNQARETPSASTSNRGPPRRRNEYKSRTSETIESTTQNAPSRVRTMRPKLTKFSSTETLPDRHSLLNERSTERISKYRTRPTSEKPSVNQENIRTVQRFRTSEATTASSTSTTVTSRPKPLRPLPTRSKSTTTNDEGASGDSNLKKPTVEIRRGNFRPNLKSDSSKKSGKGSEDEEDLENENYPEHFKSILQAKNQASKKSSSTQEALATKASEVVLNIRDSDVPITTFSPPRRQPRVRPIPLLDQSMDEENYNEKSKEKVNSISRQYPSDKNNKISEEVVNSSTEQAKKPSPKYVRTNIFNATRFNLLKKEKVLEIPEITTEKITKFSPASRNKFQGYYKSTTKINSGVTPTYSSDEDNNLINKPSSEVKASNEVSKPSRPTFNPRRTQIINMFKSKTKLENIKSIAQRKNDRGVILEVDTLPKDTSVLMSENNKYVVPIHTGQRTNRFSARYKSPLNKPSPPAYNPTVPSVTSTTAWLKFFVTDASLAENLTEPIWFVAADGQSQWKSDHQIVRSSDHHLTENGEENFAHPDFEVIAYFDHPRSTPVSDSLITAESAVMTSKMLNVETSHHSPSITVSIFDALADILTSTPKPPSSTQKKSEDTKMFGVSTESVSSSAKGSFNKDIESTVQTESYTSQVTTNKPVQTAPRSTPQVSSFPSVIPIDPQPATSTPGPSSMTLPVTERKPFATLILFSTTQPPAQTASLVSHTATPSTISRTEQSMLDVNNNNIPNTQPNNDDENTILSNEPSLPDDGNEPVLFNFAFLYNFVTNTTPPSPEFKKRFENLILKNFNVDELNIFKTGASVPKVDDSLDSHIVESTPSPTPRIESRLGDLELTVTVEPSVTESSANVELTTEEDIFTPIVPENHITTVETQSSTAKSVTSTIGLLPQQNDIEPIYFSERKLSTLSASLITEYTESINFNSNLDSSTLNIPLNVITPVVTVDSSTTENYLSNTTPVSKNSMNFEESMVDSFTTLKSDESLFADIEEGVQSSSAQSEEVLSTTSTPFYTTTNFISALNKDTESSTLDKTTESLNLVTFESTTVPQSTTSVSDSETSTTNSPSPDVNSKLLTILNMLASYNVNASSDSGTKQSLSRRAKLLRDIEKIILDNDISSNVEEDTTPVEISTYYDKKDLQVFEIPAIKDIMSTIFPEVISSSTENLTTTVYYNQQDSEMNSTPGALSTSTFISFGSSELNITTPFTQSFTETEIPIVNIETTTTMTISTTQVPSTTTTQVPSTTTTQVPSTTTTQVPLTTTTQLPSTMTTHVPSTTTTQVLSTMTTTQTTDIDTTTDIESTTTYSTTPPYKWVPAFPTAWRNKQSSTSNIPQKQSESTTETLTTTVRPKKDYYIYGVLPNNTVVRKNPNNNELETLTEASPFIIFGLLPNNSVIRRYPNGTKVPPVTQKIDVLPIDPRSLQNPNSPVYKDPDSIKILNRFNNSNNTDDINTNEITPIKTSIKNPESDDLIDNKTTDVPVHITTQMLPNMKNSGNNKLSSIIRDKTTTESNVLNLLTTAKLPNIGDIVSSSIEAASKEEVNDSTEESTTPRFLTLDIDPETKKVRTEKPADGSEGVVFRWKPLSNDILTTPEGPSTETYIQKITTIKPKPTTTTTLAPTTTTSSTVTYVSSQLTTVNTVEEFDDEVKTPAATTAKTSTLLNDYESTRSTSITKNVEILPPDFEFITSTSQFSSTTSKPLETTYDSSTILNDVIDYVEIFSRGGKSNSFENQLASTVPTTSTPYVSSTMRIPSKSSRKPTLATPRISTTQYPTTTTTSTQRMSLTEKVTEPTTKLYLPSDATTRLSQSTTSRRKNVEQTTRKRMDPTTRRTTTAAPIELSSIVSRLEYFDTSDSPTFEVVTPPVRKISSTVAPRPTSVAPQTTTFSVEDDIAFLKALQKLVKTESSSKEETLANRIIALAVEKNLQNLKNNSHTVPQSSPKPTTTTTTTTTPRTTTTVKLTTTESFRGGKKYNIVVNNNNLNSDASKPSDVTPTPSIEEDIASFQKDVQLLQTLLKLTGQDPKSVKIPTLTPDLSVFDTSSSSPSTQRLKYPSSSQPSSSQKPTTVRNTRKPTTTRPPPPTAKTIVRDEVSVLENFIKSQNVAESTTIKLDLSNLNDEKTLALLLGAKPVSSTSAPVKLSTEYGKTNEALLAAFFKDQGIGPSTPHDQKRLAALLNQVVVTPKARTTTRKPNTTTRQPRPVLDGLAWLWQQWQDTGSGSVSGGGSRATRRPVAGGGGGLFYGSGPFIGNAGDDNQSSRLQSSNNKVPLPPPHVVDSSTSSTNTGLVTAAINVTRAFSQFLGAAIQGAASTFQTVVKAGQRAAGNYYSAGSG